MIPDNNFQIIAALASVYNKRGMKNIISNLIDKVVASIFYYDKSICYRTLLNTCDKLNETTEFFNKKKLIVINISEYDRLEPSISVNRNHIKIVDINLFTF